MIEVRVPMAAVANIDNELNKINTLMWKLHDGGIPIRGHLVAWAIQRGTLVVTADNVFEEFIYQWFDENEKVSV